MYIARKQPLARSEYAIINRKSSLARALTSITLGGRPHAYSVTTTYAASGQSSVINAHGNSAAWPSNELAFDSKYGYGTRVISTRTDGSSGEMGAWTWSSTSEGLNTVGQGATMMYIGSVSNAQPTATTEYALMNLGGSGDSSGNRLILLNNAAGVKNKLRTRVLNRSNLNYVYSDSVDCPTDRVVCIVVTHEKSTGQKIYIDGKLATSQNTTINIDIQRYTNQANSVIIRSGGGSNDGTYMLATWTRALDPNEIQQLYENPHQLLSNNSIFGRLLNTHIPDLDDINAAVAEPSIPVPSGSGIRQFLGRAMVNRGNSFGRDTQFLWSAATPLYDATGNYLATNSSDRANIFSANIFGEPPQITASAEGLQYTGTTTAVGAGTGGGIVFRGLNNSSTTGDWTAAPAGRGNGVSVVILGRYTSTASNQRLFASSNQQNSGVTQSFAIVSGRPRLSYTGSYTQTENFAGTDTVPYTLGQVHLTVYVATPQGQFIYVDGKLAGQIGALHYGGATGPGARLAIVPGGMAPIMIAYINKPLTRQEVRQLTANPWQLYRQPQVKNQLLHTLIPDFTAQFAPPSTIRSTYLTTPSKYDSNNRITHKLLFASSPAHGNTDGVNQNTTWTNSSGIQVVPGRGGLAWVYGRAQNSSSTGLSKQISNANWSMLSVFSAEVNHLSQITPGYYLAGPSFGSSSVPRLLVYDNGRMGLVTLNNSIDVNTVTITPRRVNTIAVTSDGNFTRFYLNGKLVHTSSTVFNSGGSVTYQPQRIFTTDIVAGTGLRPWYIYLSALWERPLLEHEVAKLSQDPFQLFKRPDTTNHKILSGQYKYVETDANGRWIPYTEQPAYVNHSDLPRAYIPVNKGHPLANRMLYCTTPSHGSRDAYHQDLQWLSGTGADFASSYNYGIYSRYGLAWRMKGYQIRRTFYFTQGNPSPRLQLTNYTMVQFLSIEQDNYPIVDGDRSLMGFGYANALHMYISRWGEIYLAYPYLGSSRTARQYSGSQRIPLRKLVAVACVATPSDISFYIDGRLVGYTTALNSTLLPFDLQETGGGGAYVNALGNWAFSFNHSMLHVYLSATWRRALSQNEIASFSQNPGQIFEHYEKFKRIYPEATPEQFFNKFFLFFG